MSQQVIQRKIYYYKEASGGVPFLIWINSLRDTKTKAILLSRISRAGKGLFGDVKGLGSGLQELRVDYGPGFRIYMGVDENNQLIIILAGGTKRSQQADIDMAQKYWADYKKRAKEA